MFISRYMLGIVYRRCPDGRSSVSPGIVGVCVRESLNSNAGGISPRLGDAIALGRAGTSICHDGAKARLGVAVAVVDIGGTARVLRSLVVIATHVVS